MLDLSEKRYAVFGVANEHSLCYAITKYLIEAGASVVMGCQANFVARVERLAEGLGVDTQRVSSPTFAIRHDHVGRVTLLHLDFYRLHDPEEVEWLGMLDAPDDAVIAVEWADRLPGALPDDRLEIAFTVGPGPDDRSITWTARGPRAERALAALRAAHGG